MKASWCGSASTAGAGTRTINQWKHLLSPPTRRLGAAEGPAASAPKLSRTGRRTWRGRAPSVWRPERLQHQRRSAARGNSG